MTILMRKNVVLVLVLIVLVIAMIAFPTIASTVPIGSQMHRVNQWI